MRDASVAHSGIDIKSLMATQVWRIRRPMRWRKLDDDLWSALCIGNSSVSESSASEGIYVEGGDDSVEGSLARSWVGEFGKDL